MSAKSSIKKMSYFHVKQVYQLGVECLPSEAWTKSAVKLEKKNPHAVTFVAINQRKIIGFVNAHCILDEGYINNMAVSEDYRSKGVGAALLEQLMLYGKKNAISFFTLEVRKSNREAISFYKHQGFVLVGERKNFYENPQEDALLYTKRFVELINERKKSAAELEKEKAKRQADKLKK